MSLSCFSLFIIYLFCLIEQLCNNEQYILAAFCFMLDICTSSWRLNEKVRIGLYLPPCTTVSYLLTDLLTTRRVPGYPLSYPVGYPGNELPDNGSPSDNICFQRYFFFLCENRSTTWSSTMRSFNLFFNVDRGMLYFTDACLWVSFFVQMSDSALSNASTE